MKRGPFNREFVPGDLADMSIEWNDGATTFTAIKMNVTDTASASGSLLMDLQVDGSSKFSVDKSGDAEVNGLTLGLGGGSVANNTASGYRALYSNTTGGSNTASGFQALYSNTTGGSNTASGYRALYSNTTGGSNTASGVQALRNNTTGGSNTASGVQALRNNTTGYSNTASGYRALYSNTTGGSNTASGYRALYSNTTGGSNTAVGREALDSNTTGYNNTAVGRDAGGTITTGSNLSTLGYNAQPSSATATNEVTLGDSNVTTLRCNTQTISALSDARDKVDVETLSGASSLIMALRPVSFVWDQRDGGRKGQADHGFIAQDLLDAQSVSGVPVPDLVNEANPERLEASYAKLFPMVVSALQDALSRIEDLESAKE